MKFSYALLGYVLLFGVVFSLPTLAVNKVKAPRGTLSVFAGGLSGQGYRDGNVAVARFSYPTGLAADRSGAVFVADSRNCVIRRIAGDGTVSTYAGMFGRIGSADGQGTVAEFNLPVDVAVDAAGNVYVADNGNSTIRKIDRNRAVTTLAGIAKKTGSADGMGSAALFNGPSALVVDARGNIYVADSGNNTIRKITPTGEVTTFAGKAGASGSVDGKGPESLFSGPSGLAIDSAGNLYVADTGNQVIRRISSDSMVSTVAGAAGQSGSTDGLSASARFKGPSGVAVDAHGSLYVADTYNQTIRKISPDGMVTTLAGATGQTGSVDGNGTAARFQGPARLTTDTNGNLYVTDNNSQIRRIDKAGIVKTYSGAPAQSGTTDGVGVAARFSFTNGLVFDREGNLFVADMDNSTIRKITRKGVVTTFAGTAGKFGNTDGIGSAALFGGANTIAIDAADNLYVAEFYNNTIRKITKEGVVTTFAGASGKSGSSDGKGTAAQFSAPNDVTTDSAGNLYVADFNNNTIRKITPDGVVSTLAGSPGNPGSHDGTGSAASFDGPAGVVTDENGNVYVTELNNHTVRKITPTGVVTTVAGQPGKPGSGDGTGTAARLNAPWGITMDGHGNLYVCDAGNNMIRKITPAGIVTTVVGKPGPYWNLPGNLPAKLTYPLGIAVDHSTGDLYVTVPDAVLKVTLE